MTTNAPSLHEFVDFKYTHPDKRAEHASKVSTWTRYVFAMRAQIPWSGPVPAAPPPAEPEALICPALVVGFDDKGAPHLTVFPPGGSPYPVLSASPELVAPQGRLGITPTKSPEAAPAAAAQPLVQVPASNDGPLWMPPAPVAAPAPVQSAPSIDAFASMMGKMLDRLDSLGSSLADLKAVSAPIFAADSPTKSPDEVKPTATPATDSPTTDPPKAA